MASNAGPQRPALSETACKRFAALALLDRMVGAGVSYHVALLEGDDSFLDPVFDYLLHEDLVTIGEDDHYRPTPLGRRAYQRLLHQQQSYLAQFDIYAGVDLGEGTFAEPDADYLDDPRWSDLRVAVAEFKGVDPYRMVFLSMLASGQFFANQGWKFDLALGSSFFSGLGEIVRSQIALEELAYTDDDGTAISGEDVLQDVILQGAALNQERLAELRDRPPEPEEDEEPQNGKPAKDAGLLALVPYDPFGPAAAYASSPRFVESLWLEPYW